MDQEKIIELAKRNLMEVNSNDYPLDLMEKLTASYTPNHIDHLASNGHMHVVEINGEVVGCGTIMPFWRKDDQSILMSIYVLPEMHGRGIGRFIMAALESDEFYMRSRRIEIPATITALGFYEKFGYCLIGGRKQPDEEGSCRMEKIRKVLM